ncbi:MULTISPECIES: ABC transporter permease [Bosea]|uniref:Peptide/nickel transport system permease protein n=1 Tax=Bosea robiniae TaxID=1036780 RepID=A0ABY0P1N2_9HYPH|nr:MULTISPECIES: ABC transporter permease [Bosea]TQI74948.1 peptide/nickel transport system permease protein [Bosea sp. AK1]SDG52389.1 peptide/nickel transport system permease protein [Bosea robiniae]
MASFALKRILVAVLVAFTVSVVSFTVLRLSADLAQALAGEGASSEQVEQIRISYGLDRPLALQYLDWLGNIIRGDLGESYYFKQPVSALILERVPVTFTVATLAIGLALLLAIPLGICAALNRNSWLDRLCLTTAVVGQAVPSFWLALMLIYIFGLHWQWLPLSGSEEWQGFILPIIVLAYYAMPAIMRLTRAGMIEVLHADYIRTARAKGLSLRAIVTTHALRNALMPVVALAAVQFGFLLGGSTVVETVFALHGVGYLSWESIQRADFPVVQSIVLMFSMIFVVLTLASDLLNAAIDPRVRLQ